MRNAVRMARGILPKGALGVLVMLAFGAAAAAAVVGEIGPSTGMTANGRQLAPAGRMTPVGDFPSGGALSPDGRYYWAVDSGHGHDDVQIVQVASGQVRQVLPLPGAYGAVAFAPDGRTAYVSGEPKGSITPEGPTKADAGDAIHVFSVGPDGHATELDPIQLPAATPGNPQDGASSTFRGWPDGLAVTPDGRQLVVALNQADRVAIVDLATRATQLVPVGQFPDGVAIDRNGKTAYVTDEYDGDVSVVDLASATRTATIGVGGTTNPDGGPNPNQNAHPEGIVTDPARDRAYVAVTNRDLVAIVDTASDQVLGYVDVARSAGLGAAPVALALSPDGRRLYVADAGEDALAVIALNPEATAGQLIGRIPTAAYTTGAAVTPSGRQVVWLAAKGLGAGPNPTYGENWANSGAAPYGSYVVDMLLGRVGVLDTPSDSQLLLDTQAANREVVPANAQQPPADTPLRPGGPIKHVFLIIRENRTYDQVFGTDPRGDGDPRLELIDDNGVPGPTGGVTPNAHALARTFPLLDHFYSDSEVSQDGHKVTSSAYATDFVQRALHANYSGRGRSVNTDHAPVANPPRDYLFDQAARQGITFRNYGEGAGGTSADDGRPTYAASVAGKDAAWPGHFGCDRLPINSANCSTDSGTMTGTGDPTYSRFDRFKQEFEAQLASASDGSGVPAFNYLILPNDHTNGTKPGFPTPRALIADNDLGLGQIVDLISHSSIWGSTAIFVMEDDSQDGADHVDAHRQPAFVISPYARRGAVVHTRYDQDSMLHSVELILGMHPLSLFDALATPMYDAFQSQPDTTPYSAVQPEYPLGATNSAAAPDARLSSAMPFTTLDLTPQEINDRVLWHSVKGQSSPPPPPGPNASLDEAARAKVAMRAYRKGGNVRAALLSVSPGP